MCNSEPMKYTHIRIPIFWCFMGSELHTYQDPDIWVFHALRITHISGSRYSGVSWTPNYTHMRIPIFGCFMGSELHIYQDPDILVFHGLRITHISGSRYMCNSEPMKHPNIGILICV